MTALEKRLVNNWATVIMGGVKTLDDVPYRVIMIDGKESTLKEQVEIEIAKRELGI
jgi:hypothetical protein